MSNPRCPQCKNPLEHAHNDLGDWYCGVCKDPANLPMGRYWNDNEVIRDSVDEALAELAKYIDRAPTDTSGRARWDARKSLKLVKDRVAFYRRQLAQIDEKVSDLNRLIEKHLTKARARFQEMQKGWDDQPKMSKM